MKTMNIQKTVCAAAVMTALMLSACSSSWDDKYGDRTFEALPTATISVSESQLSFGSGVSSQRINVKATGYWTLKTSADWLSFGESMAKEVRGKDNAIVVVTASPNQTTQERSAAITLSNGISSLSVNAGQKGLSLPVVNGIYVAKVSKHEATLNFGFSSDDVDITAYGLCYSGTTATPTVSNATVVHHDLNAVLENSRKGSPTFTIRDLASKTSYYVRGYVETSLGTHYGEVSQITTLISMPEEDDNGMPQD